MKKFVAVLLTLVLALTTVGSVNAGTDWEFTDDVQLVTLVNLPAEDCAGVPDLVYCEFLTNGSIAYWRVTDFEGDPASHGINLYGNSSGANIKLYITFVNPYIPDSVGVYVWFYSETRNLYVPFPDQGQWEWTEVWIARETGGAPIFNVDAVRLWDSPPPIEINMLRYDAESVYCYNEFYLTVHRVDRNTLQLQCGSSPTLGITQDLPLLGTTQLYQLDTAIADCFNGRLNWSRLTNTFVYLTCN